MFLKISQNSLLFWSLFLIKLQTSNLQSSSLKLVMVKNCAIEKAKSEMCQEDKKNVPFSVVYRVCWVKGSWDEKCCGSCVLNHKKCLQGKNNSIFG